MRIRFFWKLYFSYAVVATITALAIGFLLSYANPYLHDTLGMGIFVGLFVALIVGLFVTSRIISPINEMQQVAKSLRSGRFGARVAVNSQDEIGELGVELNRLAADLLHLEGIRRDFVANVSHEFRTPLTSIKGYVETLLSGALHDEENNTRFLQKIDAHVERLSVLVQDLLSLARIEAHENALPAVPNQWSEIVEALVARYESNLKRRGLNCTIACDEKVNVLGDAEAMTQVLENLFANAMKYTPSPGEITIKISKDNGRGVLEVIDTGIGIPESDHERIFERFYRVDKARSREMGGTGLGLSIVKHLVQAMHGEVLLKSIVGKGSIFMVKLPLA